jgi:hypothetical protein
LSPTWREIFAGDWDGNGNDEGAFYRRSDGRLQTYQMTAVGGLGAALNSYDINDDWTEIVSADLDGDGDDETGFYRGSDGLFVTYEMSASGSLGTRINSLDLYP